MATFDTEGRFILTVDERSVRVWDRQSPASPVAERFDLARDRARFAPSSDAVFAISEDGTGDDVYRWDWKTDGKPTRVSEYRGLVDILDLDVSPDGRMVLTAGSDGIARLWDVEAKRERAALRAHDGVVFSARFGPDAESIVTSGSDGTARIWSTATAEQLRVLEAGRGLRVAVFDPDGSRVLAGAADGSIHMWDAGTARSLSVFRGHTDLINTVSFSSDGHLILSASDDRTAKIYECRQCQGLEALRADAEELLRRTSPPRIRAVSTWALQSGDCYESVGARKKLMPCGEPHDAEVFAVLQHPADFTAPFDEAEVSRYARRECEGRPFSEYVGTPASKSRYRVDFSWPSDGSWRQGDRRIACYLEGHEERLTGSARGTER